MDRKLLSIVVIDVLLVFASVAVIAFAERPFGFCSCGAPFCPTPPGCSLLQNETLNVLSFQLNSPTSLTLEIINSGAVQLSLIAYYVKDPQNHQYANPNWPGPAISPSTVVEVDILIDGIAFTFQQSNTYTVEVVTARNSQFFLTITT